MQNQIFLLNGTAGAGKDTFVQMCNLFIPAYHYSIVSCIKDVAKQLGCDVQNKTEKTRKFLSDLFDLSMEYNKHPLYKTEEFIADFLRNTDSKNAIAFIDVRNPSDIDFLVRKYDFKTVLVRNSNGQKIESNHADKDVDDYEYDFYIDNDGSLSRLREKANSFVLDYLFADC